MRASIGCLNGASNILPRPNRTSPKTLLRHDSSIRLAWRSVLLPSVPQRGPSAALSETPPTACAAVHAELAAGGRIQPRLRVQSYNCLRNRPNIRAQATKKHRLHKTTQKRKNPEASGTDSNAKSEAASAELKSDSPGHLFAAARAAALQAGEDQQSAKFSAAIAADAASVAASTAGLARASARDAAVAAERAALWATGAADELAEAAAAAEDLVIKICGLQKAEGSAAQKSAVEALMKTAQAAAKAAITLKHSLSDAIPQTRQSNPPSPTQDTRSDPTPPPVAAATDTGLASPTVAELSTNGRTLTPSPSQYGTELSSHAAPAADYQGSSPEADESMSPDAQNAVDPTKITREDKVMMQRALQLARRGVSFTEPNPAVGCVILDCSGQVVGEGFHPAAGQPHAEVFALRGAGQAAKGGTAYVTLEPCNHYGRTPPCALALIEAKLARVVVGVQDPNPLVAGSGMQTLRDAGIFVAGPCEEAACWEVNKEFMERMAAVAARKASGDRACATTS